MKKSFALLCAMMAVLSASALTFTVDNIEYSTITTSQVAITGGTRSYISVYPTVTYNSKTYEIWCIADGAFKNSNTVEYLEINSENFAYIGAQAFMGCTKLKSINFRKVTDQCQFYIDKEAFSGCNNAELTFLSFPEEGVDEIYADAFKSCTSLKYVYFYDVMYISSTAFSGCKNLATIGWDNSKTVKVTDDTHTSSNAISVTDGSLSPFYGLRNYLQHIGVYGPSVQDFLFQNFTNIEDLTIGGDVVRIGKNAFDGCLMLAKVDGLSSASKLQDIDDYAFYKCPITSNFYLSNSALTHVGANAFYGHKAEIIRISSTPTNGMTIGENAFRSNTTKEIYVGGNISSIGDDAFSCPNAEKIAYRMSGDTDPYQSTDSDHSLFTDCKSVKTLTVDVLFEVKPYTFAQMRVEKAEINCRNIQETTFFKTSLKEVALTESQAKDFITPPFSYSLETLASLTYSGGTHIPDYLAAGLQKLTNFTFNKSIQSIGKYAFARTGLTDIVFQYAADGLKEIDDYAFYKCTGLNAITCPYFNPPTLGTGVFAGCVEDLKKVTLTIPNSAEANYKKANGWKEFFDVYIEYPVSIWNGYRQTTVLSNENNSAIEGSVYYNYTTNTLVLNNTADYFNESEELYVGGEGLSMIWIDQELMPSPTLTIQLVGNNRMGGNINLGDAYKNATACNLTITGDGSLICDGGITIAGGTVTFDNLKDCKMGSITRCSYYPKEFPACEVMVNHSYLTLNGYCEGVVDVDNFTLNDCKVVSPEGAMFRDNHFYVNDALVPSRTDLVIEPYETGINDINTPAVQARKVLIDGAVYILRNGKVYDVRGTELL